MIDPADDCKFQLEKGKVTITVPGTWHDLTYTSAYSNLNAPRVLREIEGDFRLQARVDAFPLPEAGASSGGDFSFTSSGLLVWEDDKNFIRMDRAAVGGFPIPFVWVEQFADGKSASRQQHPIPDEPAYLRLERKGDWITFSVAEDAKGTKWVEIHEVKVALPKRLLVGVLAINTTKKELVAKLEGLELTPTK